MPSRWRLLLLAAVCLAGCSARSNSSVVESRLRLRERELAKSQRTIKDLEDRLARLQKSADTNHLQLASHQSEASSVHSISINPWLSGEAASSQRDELLVLLTPLDAAGEVIKIPGEVVVTAVDPRRDDGQHHSGRWTFDRDQVAQSWYRGWLGSGFQLHLPWDDEPPQGDVVVHVKFRVGQQSAIEATQILRRTATAPAKAETAQQDDHERRQPAIVPWPADEDDWSTTANNAPVRPVPQPLIELDEIEDAAAPPQHPRVETSDRWMADEIPVRR